VNCLINILEFNATFQVCILIYGCFIFIITWVNAKSNPTVSFLYHYIRNNYEKIEKLGYLCRKLQIQFAQEYFGL